MLNNFLKYDDLKSKIKSNFIVRSLREAIYKRKFDNDLYGAFWGVFETFEEAIQAAPKSKPMGYDDLELAKDYQEKLPKNIESYDYPMLFWLKEILNENYKVFDFGGNVGIHFFLYEKYLKYPHTLEWMVCDVPAITKAGEELAIQNKTNKLKFTNSFEMASDYDIFLASGSIQYVGSLSCELSKLSRKPKYLLINRLPLYAGKQFVTLQNGGQVFYPQFVFKKEEFIGSLLALGYVLIDQWKDLADSCWVRFPQEKFVYSYTGLYFKLNQE